MAGVSEGTSACLGELGVCLDLVCGPPSGYWDGGSKTRD